MLSWTHFNKHSSLTLGFQVFDTCLESYAGLLQFTLGKLSLAKFFRFAKTSWNYLRCLPHIVLSFLSLSLTSPLCLYGWWVFAVGAGVVVRAILLSLAAFVTGNSQPQAWLCSYFWKQVCFCWVYPLYLEGLSSPQAFSGKPVTWNWWRALNVGLLRALRLLFVPFQNTLCLVPSRALGHTLQEWMGDTLTPSSYQTNQSDKWQLYTECTQGSTTSRLPIPLK